MDNQTTAGSFEDEKTASDAFDAIASADPRFSHLYAEVEGRYIAPSPFDRPVAPRIDRVLMPSRALQEAGWLHGPIGVEIKASGKKLGRVVAQAIDYTRASFEVKPGFHVPVGMVFVFPATPLRGDLDSVAVQNRVGTCNLTPNGELVFFRGQTQILSVREPHRNFVQLRKVGSR